jgi:hypothetical protein
MPPVRPTRNALVLIEIVANSVHWKKRPAAQMGQPFSDSSFVAGRKRRGFCGLDSIDKRNSDGLLGSR